MNVFVPGTSVSSTTMFDLSPNGTTNVVSSLSRKPASSAASSGPVSEVGSPSRVTATIGTAPATAGLKVGEVVGDGVGLGVGDGVGAAVPEPVQEGGAWDMQQLGRLVCTVTLQQMSAPEAIDGTGIPISDLGPTTTDR